MRVFLSFASSDRPAAEEIQLALLGDEHEVFFDEASLPAGSDYNTRIRDAIRECDLYIYLISPASVGVGRYVHSELTQIKAKWPKPWGRVLPVMLESVDLAELDPYLKAATVLEPDGNVAAETAAAITRLPTLKHAEAWRFRLREFATKNKNWIWPLSIFTAVVTIVLGFRTYLHQRDLNTLYSHHADYSERLKNPKQLDIVTLEQERRLGKSLLELSADYADDLTKTFLRKSVESNLLTVETELTRKTWLQDTARYLQRSESGNPVDTIEEGKALALIAPSDAECAPWLETINKTIRELQEGLSAQVMPKEPIASSASSSRDLEDPSIEYVLSSLPQIDVSFLERGVQASRAVARITVKESGRTLTYATGFLVSPELLITVEHALPSVASARESFAEFNYQNGPDGLPLTPITVLLDPDRLHISDRDLDFTLVAVKPDLGSGETDLGLSYLECSPKELHVGGYVSVIQHSHGGPKTIAFRESRIIDLLDDYVHYTSNTSPGSSGAPVFDDDWRVVAIHHSKVPARDTDGDILNIEGKKWERSHGQVLWIAKEGILIDSIVARLKKELRTLSSENSKLLQEFVDRIKD